MNNRPSSSPDNQLDRLLQDWSAKQESATDHLDTLRNRVLQSSIDAVSQSSLVEPWNVNHSAERSTITVRMALCALAASLLIGVLVWRNYPTLERPIATTVGESERQPHGSGKPTQAGSASLPQRNHPLVDFTKQKLLMRKLLSVYDQPLLWVAESQDSLQVELAQTSEQAKTDGEQPWLLIRLTVESQAAFESSSLAPDEQQAKPLWQLDLLVRNEQVVNLSDRTDQDQRLMVWPCVTDDGLVMIDTQFDGLGPMKTQGNQTNLLRPGSRTRLTSVNDQYAVCQYVEVIH